MPPLPGFCAPTYQERSLNFDAQRCVNLYPVPGVQALGEQGSKTASMLVGSPGLTLFTNVGVSPIRGMLSVGTLLFVASGNQAYSIQTNGIVTAIGTLNTTSGVVSIIYNNNFEVAFADGVNLYVYNYRTNTFTIIPSANLVGSPTWLSFLDQYIVAAFANSQAFQLSGLNAATSWSTLNNGLAESDPDNLLAIWLLNQQLYMLGEFTTEIWWDAGSTGFLPFARSSGVINYGIEAINSGTIIANSLAWLGRNRIGGRQAMLTQGASPTVVSTPALETQWGTYSTVADAYSFAYRVGGRENWVLTFPSAPNGGATFVYDVVTGLWHERASITTGPAYTITGGQWIAYGHAIFNGQQMVGDFFTGNIYIIDPTNYTENGNPIIRRRVSPHYWNNLNFLTMNSLQVDFEGGTGLPSGQGSNPMAKLRWSKDGAHTWGNYHESPIGPIGNYQQRAIWRTLGISRDWVFDLQISDPIRVAFMDAVAEMELSDV